jgi:hypothetical protein
MRFIDRLQAHQGAARLVFKPSRKSELDLI